MTIYEPRMSGVRFVSARCAGVKLLVSLMCVSVPLLCCAQQVLSQATQSSDETMTAAEAEHASILEHDLSSIESRIAALTPSHSVVGGTRFATVSLMGYDLDAPAAGSGTARVAVGETYALTPYFKLNKWGDVEFDLVIRLGDMFVGREHIQIAAARPGEVIKRELAVRMPLTMHAGETSLFFSVVDIDQPVFARGGTVEVEDRRTQLTVPVQNAPAGCLVRGNMVPNPSFEDISQQSVWIPDWEKSKLIFGCSVVMDVADAHHGTRSLMMDFHGGIDASVWALPGVEIGVTPGREYSFGFYYKTKDLPPVPEGMRGPCVQIKDANNTDVRIALSDLALPEAPTEWTRHERSVKVPEGTDRILIRFRRYGSIDSISQWSDPITTYVAGGTVWIDCMWLVPKR